MTGRRYLFVIDSLHAGGAERSLVELLPRLVERGVTPVLVCLQRRDVGFEEDAGVAGYQIHYLPPAGRLGRIVALRRLLRRLRPDLVYTSLFEADLTGRLAAAGLGIPVMSNLANTSYDPARLADPNVARWRLGVVRAVDGWTARRLTDHFHAVSQAVKDSTVDTLGVDPDRITVVRRGREVERIGRTGPERRRRVRRALGVPDDAELVVTAGRHEYQKGHRHLIDAFARVVEARPRAWLLVAGRRGNLTADLERRITAAGLDDRVRLLGHRGDVTDVMAAADLFVFPSVYEGLGGALIEATALGLPVVASDLPALREVVVPGENALLVPPGDPEALGDAIVTLLADPERRERFGQRGREIFSARFSAGEAADRMLALLDSVAGAPETPLLDDDTAVSLVSGMHDGRDGVGRPGEWSVVDDWGSFKAHFFHLRQRRGTTEVALKVGEGWTAEDARFVVAEVGRVGELLRMLPGGAVRVPEALGWSDDPAAVALRFVPGENLFHVLADPHHPRWDGGEAEVTGLIRLCGQALGAYHTAEPADPDDRAAAAAARTDLLKAARRAGVRAATAMAVEPHLRRARGYRFSANDFTVEPGGGLVMLDPPHVRKFDYVQRDVSAFTFEMHRFLAGFRRVAPGHPAAGRLDRLRDAFLEGYAVTGPAPLDTPLDRWMIRFYELSRVTGRAYGELRHPRWHTVPGLLRWAADLRRSLGPPPLPDRQ